MSERQDHGRDADAPAAADEPVSDDTDTLRLEIEKLRRTLREARTQLRVIHTEIDSYEEIAAARRVLLEHLVFEKKAFESARETGTSAQQQQIEMLRVNIAEAKAELYSDEKELNLRQAIADLRAAEEIQRERDQDARQKHSERVATHERFASAAAEKREELGHELATVREQIDELATQAADGDEPQSPRVQELELELEAVQVAAAEAATSAENQARTLLDELPKTRDEIAAETRSATELEEALSRAESSRQRLRARLREMEGLISLLSGSGAEGEANAADKPDAGGLDFDPDRDLDLDRLLPSTPGPEPESDDDD